MPHQCTTCGKVFADGSKEMLSGCPGCGGNKFQFRPSGSSGGSGGADSTGGSGAADATNTANAANSADGGAGNGGSGTASSTETAAPDSSTSDPSGSDERTPSTGAWPATARRAGVDESQGPQTRADQRARTDQQPRPDQQARAGDATTEQSSDEAQEGTADWPSSEDTAQASARSDVVSKRELDAAAAEAPQPTPEADDRPDLSELRDELNDQFESIKIVNPGQYELNLMELYDRQEYIISLREDGRYVIEVPDRWGDGDDE